jgi:hypothetical protein
VPFTAVTTGAACILVATKVRRSAKADPNKLLIFALSHIAQQRSPTIPKIEIGSRPHGHQGIKDSAHAGR